MAQFYRDSKQVFELRLSIDLKDLQSKTWHEKDCGLVKNMGSVERPRLHGTRDWLPPSLDD